MIFYLLYITDDNLSELHVYVERFLVGCVALTCQYITEETEEHQGLSTSPRNQSEVFFGTQNN